MSKKKANQQVLVDMGYSHVKHDVMPKSKIIRFMDEAPPNDYNYTCIVVFNDGYETKSDGGTVHDVCAKSGIAYGWRRYISNKDIV
jgi:hypothetical protein